MAGDRRLHIGKAVLGGEIARLEPLPCPVHQPWIHRQRRDGATSEARRPRAGEIRVDVGLGEYVLSPNETWPKRYRSNLVGPQLLSHVQDELLNPGFADSVGDIAHVANG